MHRAESRRTTKVRASIFLSLWSQDTLLSWNWFVIICMEYCQPGEFTWALVTRDFIGASSCWRDWLTNNLSIQVDWYHMTPNLSHIVDLFDVTSIHLKTIWRWLAPSQITLLYQPVWCKAPRQTKADVFQDPRGDFTDTKNKGQTFFSGKFKFFPIHTSTYLYSSLISHASKVMLKILQARLQQYVNCELPDVQAGFGKGRGTRDQMANIRWIMEKAREFQKNIYFCSIDYAKAFDCVDHNKLWKILQEMRIPDHLICLLRNLYASQEATVRNGNGTTDWF